MECLSRHKKAAIKFKCSALISFRKVAIKVKIKVNVEEKEKIKVNVRETDKVAFQGSIL